MTLEELKKVQMHMMLKDLKRGLQEVEEYWNAKEGPLTETQLLAVIGKLEAHMRIAIINIECYHIDEEQVELEGL
jgi:hypothetical protein